MSRRRDPKTRSKAPVAREADPADPAPVASLDPACAGKHTIVVTRAGDDDAGADDRSSAAAARSG